MKAVSASTQGESGEQSGTGFALVSEREGKRLHKPGGLFRTR